MLRPALRFSFSIGGFALIGVLACGGWGAPLAGRVPPADQAMAPDATDPANAAADSAEAASDLPEPVAAVEASTSTAAAANATAPSAMQQSSSAAANTPAAPMSSGSSGPTDAPNPVADSPGSDSVVWVGAPERPQLDASTAARFTVLSYLAQSGDLAAGLSRDDWDPTAGLGDVTAFAPDYRVAPSGGTHTSVQAAVDAAVAAGGSARRYISVAAGSYREVVCVPTAAPPITLYGLGSDASQTVISFDNYAGKAKAAGASANPCSPNTNSTTFGTAGSATFAIYASDFQAKNLSFVNDTDEASVGSGAQAVALITQGDRVLLDNVRVLGNQDSLFAKTPNIDSVTRAYLKGCFVEGDTDFVCGRGTLVLDGCTLNSLSRKSGGTILAPSTDHRNPYGILISGSRFSADANAATGSVHLGRAWDESQSDLTTYAANVAAGTFPNGQALVRDSTLAGHIAVAAPWQAAATTSRPFSASAGGDPDNSPGNRLYEYTDADAAAAN